MIQAFDEKEVLKCLEDVKDCDHKFYALCLLDWAIQKRKVDVYLKSQVDAAIDAMNPDNFVPEARLGLHIAVDLLMQYLEESYEEEKEGKEERSLSSAIMDAEKKTSRNRKETSGS